MSFKGPASGGAFALAGRIWQRAVGAMGPAGLMAKTVGARPDGLLIAGRPLPLAGFRRCLIIAVGKAAAGMVRGLLPALTLPVAGVVVVPHGQRDPGLALTQIEAGHPVPDEASAGAAEAIEQLAASTTADDLVFVLLSGGASALLADPVPGVSLADLQLTTRALLASGAAIPDVNAVRKHLGRLKGGRLAALLAPARVVTLAISDVPDDEMAVIASGPTVPDPTTFAEAAAVIARAARHHPVPASVTAHLAAGRQGRVAETPKGTEGFWLEQQSHCIGGRHGLLAAAAAAARREGCRVLVAPTPLAGEAVTAGRALVPVLEALQPVAQPTCWLSAGETTVTLPEAHGRGGRNQSLALAAALDFAGKAGIGLLAGGTDGIDGPTDAAGAWVDGRTVGRGLAIGHDAVTALARHDAYGYFAAVGGHWRPGATGTNVSDLLIGLAWDGDWGR